MCVCACACVCVCMRVRVFLHTRRVSLQCLQQCILGEFRLHCYKFPGAVLFLVCFCSRCRFTHTVTEYKISVMLREYVTADSETSARL